MIALQSIIYYAYMLITAVCGFFLVKHLFRRNEHQGIVNDIMYVLCLIPFLLRVLQIK